MAVNTPVNRQWLLAARPTGRPLREDDFRYHEAAVPEPADGEILVKSLYFGFDPAQKGWMENKSSYAAPTELDAVVRGFAAGRVLRSRAAGIAEGDTVYGQWGWQDYAAFRPVDDPSIFEVIPADRPIPAALGVLGMTGLTAYFGLFDIGRPVAGDTVVISGAAGATGSVAGQLAKIAGCRVIGTAGGPDKARWLTEEFGFDAVIDYKSEHVGKRLRALCPNGVDVYFDNVGGAILNTVLARLAPRARVVICGGIARYSQDGSVPGPENYFNLVFMRARMEGFLVSDYLSRFAEAKQRLWRWIEDGRLKYRVDIQDGFANAPHTLIRLFEGQNFGKQLLKLEE